MAKLNHLSSLKIKIVLMSSHKLIRGLSLQFLLPNAPLSNVHCHREFLVLPSEIVINITIRIPEQSTLCDTHIKLIAGCRTSFVCMYHTSNFVHIPVLKTKTIVLFSILLWLKLLVCLNYTRKKLFCPEI